MINIIMKKQHHIIYVTRHPNGKFYGGRHSTYNLDDGYLGSGLWVKEMKDKSVLRREIFDKADTFEELVEKEEKWLAENYDNPNCMNFTKSGQGWGAGEMNIMKLPEIVAKISGENHWSKNEKNVDSLEKIRQTQLELVESGQHIFIGETNPNKDGQNAKLAMERGTHINLTNNPNVRKVKEGTHQMFKREDGSSIGADANIKRIEEGTHNWLGPEENLRRVEDGTHNFLGSTQNEKMLAEGRHPSQKKITCPTCGWKISSGMFKRWHGPNCHMNPDSPRYDPDKKPR